MEQLNLAPGDAVPVETGVWYDVHASAPGPAFDVVLGADGMLRVEPVDEA